MTRPHRRPSLMPRMSENWPRDRWFWSDAEGPIRPPCRSAFPTSDGYLRSRSEPLSGCPTNQSGSRDQPSTVEIHRARVMEKMAPAALSEPVRLRLARRAAAQINTLGRLSNRLQFAEHRRDELGHRRMNP